jgi:hypothetical protein
MRSFSRAALIGSVAIILFSCCHDSASAEMFVGGLYGYAYGPLVGPGGGSGYSPEWPNYGFGGLSFDKSDSAGSLQATFHLYSVASGYGPPWDGVYGTGGSYASLSVAGSVAGTATFSAGMDAIWDAGLLQPVQWTTIQHAHAVGHLAPGDTLNLDVAANTDGFNSVINQFITAPGDFAFSFDDTFSYYALSLTTVIRYSFQITRAGGEKEASYVEILDPPSDQSVVADGVTSTLSTPEPSTLMLGAFGFAGVAAWHWRLRGRKKGTFSIVFGTRFAH